MANPTKPDMQPYSRHILICTGAKCVANDEGQVLYEALKVKLKEAGLDNGESRVQRSSAKCLGTCMSGPLVCVQPDGSWYYDINSEKLDKIIEQHLIQGQPVTEYLYHQQ